MMWPLLHVWHSDTDPEGVPPFTRIVTISFSFSKKRSALRVRPGVGTHMGVLDDLQDRARCDTSGRAGSANPNHCYVRLPVQQETSEARQTTSARSRYAFCPATLQNGMQDLFAAWYVVLSRNLPLGPWFRKP